MINEINEDDYRRYELHHPTMASHTVNMYKYDSYGNYIAKLDDGRVLLWNYIRDRIRFMKDPCSMTEEECCIEFGNRLKEIMRIKNWMTQEQLSRCTGISQQEISKYINGRRNPGLYNLHKLSLALECSIDDFVYTGF